MGKANESPRGPLADSLLAADAAVGDSIEQHAPVTASAAVVPTQPTGPREKKKVQEVPNIVLQGCYSCFASMYMLVSLVAPFFPNRADDWFAPQKNADGSLLLGVGIDGWVGFIIACDAIGEILAAVIATYFLGYLGHSEGAVVGMLVNCISSAVFGLAPLVSTNKFFLLPLMVLCRLMNGLATTITYVGVFTVLCALQPGKTGTVTARATVLTSVGTLAGPLYGGTFDKLGRMMFVNNADSVSPEEHLLQTNLEFATPFIATSIAVVLPAILLWKVRDIEVESDADGAEQEQEEEQEISFVEEIKRMRSVLNIPLFAGAFALATSTAMMTAIYPILGPHLEPRCEMHNDKEGQHQPYALTTTETSLVFTVSSIPFLPLSMWIGDEADRRGRDFPWLRRAMIVGLSLNIVSFFVMGPAPFLGPALMRMLESWGSVVLAQWVLGCACAIASVVTFPYIEGICEMTPRKGTTLSTMQRISIAGVWYNTSYSAGCALGSIIAGHINDVTTFQNTTFLMGLFNLVAIAVVALEGIKNTTVTGGLLAPKTAVDDDQVDDWLRNTSDNLKMLNTRPQDDMNAQAGWWWSKQVKPASPGKVAVGLGLEAAPKPEDTQTAVLGTGLDVDSASKSGIGSLMEALEDGGVSVQESPASLAIKAAADAAEEEVAEKGPALYPLAVPFCIFGAFVCTILTIWQATQRYESCGEYYALNTTDPLSCHNPGTVGWFVDAKIKGESERGLKGLLARDLTLDMHNGVVLIIPDASGNISKCSQSSGSTCQYTAVESNCDFTGHAARSYHECLC